MPGGINDTDTAPDDAIRMSARDHAESLVALLPFELRHKILVHSASDSLRMAIATQSNALAWCHRSLPESQPCLQEAIDEVFPLPIVSFRGGPLVAPADSLYTRSDAPYRQIPDWLQRAEVAAGRSMPPAAPYEYDTSLRPMLGKVHIRDVDESWLRHELITLRDTLHEATPLATPREAAPGDPLPMVPCAERQDEPYALCDGTYGRVHSDLLGVFSDSRPRATRTGNQRHERVSRLCFAGPRIEGGNKPLPAAVMQVLPDEERQKLLRRRATDADARLKAQMDVLGRMVVQVLSERFGIRPEAFDVVQKPSRRRARGPLPQHRERSLIVYLLAPSKRSPWSAQGPHEDDLVAPEEQEGVSLS